MKKIIIIAAIIIILAAAGYFGWRYYRVSSGVTENGFPTPPPSPAGKTISPLTQKQVLGYWVDGGTTFYATPDGHIYKIIGGSETALFDQAIPDLGSFIPSTSGGYALASFGGASSPTFSVFDIAKNEWTPLPPGTVSAVWDPSKNRVAYLLRTGSGSSLRLFDVATKKSTEVTKMSEAGLTVAWATPGQIYFTDMPSAKITSSLWSFDLAKRLWKPIIIDEPGLIVAWDPTGEIGLKFTNSFKENTLVTLNRSGQSLTQAPFTTLPSKCAVTAHVIYCAVPRKIPAGTLLPDDYLTGKTSFEDDIIAWKFGVGKVGVVENSLPGIDAYELSVVGSKLFFVNRYDHKLYGIEL